MLLLYLFILHQLFTCYYSEKEQLKKDVSSIRQIGGNTFTNKPLEFIRSRMFTTQRGDRLDKDNVCVVITDGRSSDPDKTAKAAAAVSRLSS